MDAPLHFVDAARAIDRVDLDKCVGPALVVDLSHKAEHSLMTPDDLAPYAERIQPGSRVLLRTDWYKRADDDNWRTHYPRISAELAHWLVEKGVWLVGVEAPSVASMRPEEKAELIEVHQILLGVEMVIVEGLAHLDSLQQDVVEFVALPLKLENCDGSPVRAIAIESVGD